MWEIIWLRPPHPGHMMMNRWDEVLICQTIVIFLLLLRCCCCCCCCVEPRVGVAKAKQRLMTQLSHNLLWKLSVEQLKLNRNRNWSLLPHNSPSPSHVKSCQLRGKWNQAKRQSGNWRCGACKPNLSVVSLAFLLLLLLFLRPDHCGCYNFDKPASPSPRPTATGTSTQICLADRIRYNDNADDARNELQLQRLECATLLEQLPLPELPGLITLKWPMRFVFVPCTVSGQSGLCGWLRPDLVDRLRFSSLCRFVQSFHGYALRT